MADLYKNKVIYGGNVLIDLTSDTVDTDHLLYGYTAHAKSGAPITVSVLLIQILQMQMLLQIRF